MRITVAPIQIALGTFDLKIRAPGTVRYVAFERSKKLVMTGGAPDFEEHPVMFVESSPEAPLVSRRFSCIKQGDYVDAADDERAVWAGSGISGTGLVVHIFELRSETKDERTWRTAVESRP